MRGKPLVVVKDGYFCVRDPDREDFSYDIPIRDCATQADVLRWIRQLSEKNWVTVGVIEAFAVAAIHEFEVQG